MFIASVSNEILQQIDGDLTFAPAATECSANIQVIDKTDILYLIRESASVENVP